MKLAQHPSKWNSIKSSKQTFWTSSWCHFHGNIVYLKDTGKGKYTNIPLDSVTYKYELPDNTISQVEIFVKQDIMKPLMDRRTFHLYCVRNAQDYYTGLWVAYEFQPKSINNRIPFVILKRLVQEPLKELNKRKRRSNNEDFHASFLENNFKDFHVMYEPECQTKIESQLIIDGIWNSWAGNEYTVDFVLTSLSGCGRISIESKPTKEHITDETLLKCRALRDRSGQRVVIIVGSDETSIRFYDMGAIINPLEKWYNSISDLKSILFI